MSGILSGVVASSGGSVTVVGGGGTPENGFGSAGYFLSGEEIAATAFFSSAYDAQYHTAEGIEVPDEVSYQPQLDPSVVDLLEQPFTIILDGEIITSPGNTSAFGVLCDESTYFELTVDESAFFFSDNTESLGSSEVGITEPVAPGRYRVALTKTNEAVAVSINGGAVTTGGGDEMPYGPISTIVLVAKNGASITEFTIMEPQDNADLPSLSALA